MAEGLDNKAGGATNESPKDEKEEFGQYAEEEQGGGAGSQITTKLFPDEAIRKNGFIRSVIMDKTAESLGAPHPDWQSERENEVDQTLSAKQKVADPKDKWKVVELEVESRPSGGRRPKDKGEPEAPSATSRMEVEEPAIVPESVSPAIVAKAKQQIKQAILVDSPRDFREAGMNKEKSSGVEVPQHGDRQEEAPAGAVEQMEDEGAAPEAKREVWPGGEFNLDDSYESTSAVKFSMERVMLNQGKQPNILDTLVPAMYLKREAWLQKDSERARGGDQPNSVQMGELESQVAPRVVIERLAPRQLPMRNNVAIRLITSFDGLDSELLGPQGTEHMYWFRGLSDWQKTLPPSRPEAASKENWPVEASQAAGETPLISEREPDSSEALVLPSHYHTYP
ncbi:unnamed protein product [Calypogeia fissa]